MPLVFPKFNCEIVEKAEMGTILGLACPEKNVIYLREDVYDGAVDDIPMHRFTIAHEIGHFFMHTPKTVGFARNSSTKIPPFFDIEWQANTFAAELLAPPRLLKGLNRKEIQKVFGVSAKVAEIQSKQIS
ncbi:hypothetical protein J41TS12_23300 [Paenibacillus antibioticophila]|uniref:IrrE N-terminal-like domain-containing protein n=2 Tax=Paenibacillus antibioticophila TaxID=1274374 RepID=A0A919XT37_9BACL|nr:hypothetical protein J41TS12_23300 [Paenibacillus antibioticophila]